MSSLNILIEDFNKLDFLIKEVVDDEKTNNCVGIYIRCNEIEKIKTTIDRIEEYCEKNNFKNKVVYIDFKKSAIDNDRQALMKLKEDIENKRISKIIIEDVSKLYRQVSDFLKFIKCCDEKQVELHTLDSGIIDNEFYYANIINELKEENLNKSGEKEFEY